MNKKLTFFLLFSSFLLTSLFAENKIIKCIPNEILQGDSITLTLNTDSPLPQKNQNEFLYSEVSFSNYSAHVSTIHFLNQYIVNCSILTDKYIDNSKPIDITLTSYDENGEPTVFVGKKLLKIKRKTFVENIIVHTNDGKIHKGESVNITINGYNFQTGKAQILLKMSGLAPLDFKCTNPRQIRFNLTEDQVNSL